MRRLSGIVDGSLDDYRLFVYLHLFNFDYALAFVGALGCFNVQHRETGLTFFVEIGEVESGFTCGVGHLGSVEADGVVWWWGFR